MHTVKTADRTALVVIDVLEVCESKTMDLAATGFEVMTRVSAVEPRVMGLVESAALAISQRSLSGKPEACRGRLLSRLKAIQDPQGKSRGALMLSLSISRQNILPIQIVS